jgi:hypothetical protein
MLLCAFVYHFFIGISHQRIGSGNVHDVVSDVLHDIDPAEHECVRTHTTMFFTWLRLAFATQSRKKIWLFKL